MRLKKALLAGATGLVGGHLLDMLLKKPEYTEVHVVVRRTTGVSHPRLREHIVNFDALDDFHPGTSIDEVYCALGTTMKKAGSQENFRRVDYYYVMAVARLAERCEARKLLVVSALGADPYSPIFYSRVKGEVEEDLRQFSIPLIAVFRPSILAGERQEVRWGEKLGLAVMNVVSPFLILGLRKYRPIAAEDVARAMIFVTTQLQAGYTIIESDRIADLAREAKMQETSPW